MAKTLIIVESPTKIKTMKNFLGSEYQIEASYGHVRDLPEKKLGVDIEHDFKPTYEPLKDRSDILKRLQAAAKGVTEILLASDPDREGEAIAWHLAEALKIKQPRRIRYNELTRQAVQQALVQPLEIDMNRVNAQQARRVLDRLVGYKLSPVLWTKIQKGLSAGRVQSVAVRLICEREREIQAFVSEEYWSLTATLTPVAPEKRFPFAAKLHSRDGKRLEPKSQADIDAILADIRDADYSVADVRKREQKRNAAAPFITSTLQQEASRKLGFGNRKTMSVAQDLYEGIELGEEGSVGLITYMRTDSVRVAAEAQGDARRFISERYGVDYIPSTPKQFKTKNEAQDAHEAIRPTSVFHDPDSIARYLNPDQIKLYRLIWQRFVASQMNPAVMDVTTADIAATGPRTQGTPYLFRAAGSVVKFDGFMRVYTEGKDTEEVTDEEQPPLPALSKEQVLDLITMEPKQHFTEPPPRYTEATFVKVLDELGVGRPSTWASIIQVIRDREYVELREKRFYPTELGFKVNDQLVKHFPSVMDVKFTAGMETSLDEVEEGRTDWVTLLRGFYEPFQQQIETAKSEMENLKPAAVESQYHCPATGSVMMLRQSRYGAFLGCSGYPKCKKILKVNEEGAPVDGLDFACGLDAKQEKEPLDPASLPNATDHVCPEGKGRMLLRQSRRGPFLGCSSYPKCHTTLKINTESVIPNALVEGQEFVCTYSDVAPKRGGKKPARARVTAKASPAPKSAALSSAKAAAKTAAKTTKTAVPAVTASTAKTSAAKTGGSAGGSKASKAGKTEVTSGAARLAAVAEE